MHSTTTNEDAAHPRTDALAFTPPGPGVWELDVDHQNAPRGALSSDLFSEPFRSGFAEMFARYGLPLEELRSASIHGWHYTSAKPLGAPEGKGSGGPPPDFVLKVLSRVHPEFRRRNRTAAAALRDRLWLQDAEEWQHERSAWVGHCTRLDATALDELSDDELTSLAGEAGQLGRDMMRRHFALVGPALAAGRLLAAGDEWRLDPARLLELFTGASPASAATAPALVAIREELAEAGVDPRELTEFEELEKAAPHALAAFMSEWGQRPLDDDIAGATLGDAPSRLVALVAADPAEFDAHAVFQAAYDELRSQVPADERARFEELVSEVRRCYPSLDDNAGMLSQVMGSAQRIFVEVERRAIEASRLEKPGDAQLLTLSELTSVLGPTPLAVNDVAHRRDELSRAGGTPPPVLGGEAHPPPDPSVFPKAMAEVTAAMGFYLANKVSREREPAPQLIGTMHINGQQVATGYRLGGEVTARVVVARSSSEAIERAEPGAILACPVTTPAWNVIFPMLAGIVTSTGSPLGHTAVMAREFGLPAVVGVGELDSVWHGVSATLNRGMADGRDRDS